jgi:hypothetical protein
MREPWRREAAPRGSYRDHMVWLNEWRILKQFAVRAIGLAGIVSISQRVFAPTAATLVVGCLAASAWVVATIRWFGPQPAKPTVLERLGYASMVCLSVYCLAKVVVQSTGGGLSAHLVGAFTYPIILALVIVSAVQRERRGRRERAA